MFVELCAVESPDDGLTFLPESVHVEAIREDQEYGGMRVKLMAMLGNIRIPLPSAGRNPNFRRRDDAARSRRDVDAQEDRDPERTSTRFDQRIR